MRGERAGQLSRRLAATNLAILAGVENLYLSETAVFDGKAAIRGGIPVVFPQFGPGASFAASCVAAEP